MRLVLLGVITFFASVPSCLEAALVFPMGSTWKYFVGTQEASSPVSAWRTIGFNDGNWASGQGPIGYPSVPPNDPGGYEATIRTTLPSSSAANYLSVFFRKTFTISNPAQITELDIAIIIDDGYVTWINGTEVGRSNVPGGNLAYNSNAVATIEATATSLTLTSNLSALLVAGTNVIAVQVFNSTLSSSDLLMDASLSTRAPDFVAPTVASVAPGPGTISNLSQVTVTFSEPVLGVQASDLLINGQEATSVSAGGNNDTYTFTFAQPPYGIVRFTWITAHGITDYATPPNSFNATAPGASWQYNLIDLTAPTVVRTIPPVNTTVTRLEQIEVFFSEPVTGLDAADLLINGVPAASVTFGGTGQYLFSFPQPPNGFVQIGWSAAHKIKDLALPANNFAGNSWTYTLDPNFVPPTVYINELMAANLNNTNDVNGDPSDWIEIYNSTASVVSLDGWYLTDTPNDRTKWRFPAVSLSANGYLLVWASGKNRTNPVAQLHTNFKLDQTGEYLALLRPDLTLASEFSPVYPPQRNNISYGRDRVSPELLGYFQVPTPGNPNTTVTLGTAGEVVFSRASGTFNINNPFTLALQMGVSNTNAVIRYTLNGSAVSTNSPLYDHALTITNTVAVRARVFQPGLLPGPPQTEIYIALNTNVLGFTSDLPLIILHNHGAGAVSASVDEYVSTMVFEPKAGVSSLTNAPDLVTRARFKLRGSSTQNYPKGSFAFEAWDEFNDDRNIPLLGLPSESDWVFYAPNNFDPVLFENPLAYEMSRQIGRWASRTRFAEVFLNTAGGAVDTPTPSSGNYNGIYVVEEKVKIGKHRVDIDNLGPEDTSLPDLSGGYLLKQDRNDPGDFGFRGPQPDNTGIPDAPLLYVDPKEQEILLPQRDPQEQYIKNYITNFINALSGLSYTNPVSGYAAWIDVDSWIDHHLHNVITFNVDALRLSGYFHKPRNAKMNMGPVWDFDRSLNSTDGRSSNPRVWASSGGTDFFNYPWWRRLFADPDFFQRWIERYQELRTGPFSTNNLLPLVDSFANQVRDAQPREQARWGVVPRGGSYQAEVNALKQWLAARLNFADTNFLAKPRFGGPGGAIPAGYVLTISTPATEPGTLIYYTLNGTDPRLPGGAISPQARAYIGPITLSANARVVARTYNSAHRNLTGTLNPPLSSPWSGPTAATFVVTTPPLVITEIMYHPRNPPLGSTNTDEDFEYIELKNIGANSLNLIGFHITNGIEYVFTENSAITNLGPGATVLLVKNRAAFASRYPTVTNVAGEYSENLDNDGDQLHLEGPLKEPILDFAYHDDWYPITDGLGFSLVILNDQAPLNTWSNKLSWRASGVFDGSPGTNNPTPTNLAPVLVNEILSHTDLPLVDAIELYNPTSADASIGGWFLADDLAQPKKYRIPDNTVIPAGGYLVFDESQFNASPGTGNSFAFSSKGDQAYLFSADVSSNLTGYFHGFDFGAAANGVSFGRYVNSVGTEQFVAQAARTFGATNAGPLIGPVVISEIMYHPRDVILGTNRLDNALDEYIQLSNITDSSVPLYHELYPANTWKIRDGVDFIFPTNVLLGPHGFVYVVNFDPTNQAQLSLFRAQFGLSTAIPVFGPYGGKLDNSGESVELARPDTPQLPPAPDAGFVPYVLVDKVKYSNLTPWPTAADGTGAVLRRINPAAYGNDPINWSAIPVMRPKITMQPQSTSARTGTRATFSVSAESETPIRYQWQRDGANIAGATNASITISNVQPQNGVFSFAYTAVLTDSVGSITSAAGILTVLSSPLILQHLQSQTVATGSNVTFQVGAIGTVPLGYSWRKDSLPFAFIEDNPQLVIPNVQPIHAGTWNVVVTNAIYPPGVISTSAYLTVVSPPLSVRTGLGSNVTFSVTATGPMKPNPIRYQWQFNGAPILDATNPVLTLPSVQVADQGTYTVQVFNGYGMATPFSASLLIAGAEPILSQPKFLENGNFQMVLQGATNGVYIIEVSSDLKNWLSLTNLFSTNGIISFLDPGSTNSSSRFYRARVGP